MNDRRRQPPNRPQTIRSGQPRPAAVAAGPIQLDDETKNALILFNARLAAQEAAERDKRRVDKAATARDAAAAKVRALESDPKATAEAKAEAEAAYKAAVDAWNRAQSGEPPAAGESADHTDHTDDEAGDHEAGNGDTADRADDGSDGDGATDTADASTAEAGATDTADASTAEAGATDTADASTAEAGAGDATDTSTAEAGAGDATDTSTAEAGAGEADTGASDTDTDVAEPPAEPSAKSEESPADEG